jgi:hypothetical protein
MYMQSAMHPKTTLLASAVLFSTAITSVIPERSHNNVIRVQQGGSDSSYDIIYTQELDRRIQKDQAVRGEESCFVSRVLKVRCR